MHQPLTGRGGVAAVQSVLAMQQSSREHRSGGLSLRSKLAGPHSGPLSGPANPAALLSAPASLTARLSVSHHHKAIWCGGKCAFQRMGHTSQGGVLAEGQLKRTL